MPFFILSILIQLAFVIHIVKTGRNTTWIWIVVMLPMAGALAYILLEVLPSMRNSRGGRAASQAMQKTLNPNKSINAAFRDLNISDTVENSMRLAQECLDKGLFEEALGLYTKCQKGLYKEDPHVLYGQAQAQFGLSQYGQTHSTLDLLIQSNPDYKNADAHLLYARTLESLGEHDKAMHEYDVLNGYFVGPEAALYFGQFLKKQGEPVRAKQVIEEALQKAKYAGKHYHTLHKQVLKQLNAEHS